MGWIRARRTLKQQGEAILVRCAANPRLASPLPRHVCPKIYSKTNAFFFATPAVPHRALLLSFSPEDYGGKTSRSTDLGCTEARSDRAAGPPPPSQPPPLNGTSSASTRWSLSVLQPMKDERGGGTDLGILRALPTAVFRTPTPANDAHRWIGIDHPRSRCVSGLPRLVPKVAHPRGGGRTDEIGRGSVITSI